MNTHGVRLGLLLLSSLVWSGLALDCDWDQSIDPDQGLKPASLVSGALILAPQAEVLDPERCRAACCDKPDCDLALVGYPADGGLQCLLVRCTYQNRDFCVLEPSSQYKVYRRKMKRGTRVEKPHVVPLLGPWEPQTNEINSIRCRLPMKVGPCRAAFQKFFYNVTDQSCGRFVYGGCEANANNFDSQEDCEATCRGVTGSVLPDDLTPAPPELPAKAPRMAPSFNTNAATESVHPQKTEMSADEYTERCEAEPQAGPCRAAFRNWYHNSQTGKCESFIYGGCRGNKNNYNSKESCEATCTVVSVLAFSKKSSADGVSTEYVDQCLAKPDPGPCRAYFTKFYYNHKAKTCQSFIYGGCRGNQNRYSTADECMTHCSRDGSFDSRGKTRHRWTAAFFLFITLAAISALLLVTLVLISLRRHRLSRHPPSISDKEELLPDPDEQSSVESLTVPESPKPCKD